MRKKFIIGVDLGGTNLKAALLDPQCRIRQKKVLSTKSFINKEGLILGIVAAILRVIKENGLNKEDILGIGLGLPGPTDIKNGLVHFFPNIPGFKNVSLGAILRKKTGLPIFLDNDANLMCLAEQKLGAARGFRNVLCMTLGTGVGGGLILQGRLYRGSAFAAGEAGHIPINENGPRCNCGGIACLETYIGNKRILNQAAKLFKRNISLEELSALAEKKNKKAVGIWQEAGNRLGVMLVGVVNLLNLDAVVIGGGVADAGEVLFSAVRRIIAKQAMPLQAKQVKIFKAKLGPDAGLIGAGILVKDKSTRINGD
jgi:glucokinase